MTYEKMLDIAHSDMGIYPQLVTKDGITTKRTEWQDGWNAYSKEMHKKIDLLDKYLKALTDETRSTIERLLENECLTIQLEDDGAVLIVNCNDLFYWACADGERLELSGLPGFITTLAECSYGELLWCCRKRKMRPQKPYYKYFTPEEVVLFDAAGPPRTDEGHS
jgi:hypothetical protein